LHITIVKLGAPSKLQPFLSSPSTHPFEQIPTRHAQTRLNKSLDHPRTTIRIWPLQISIAKAGCSKQAPFLPQLTVNASI